MPRKRRSHHKQQNVRILGQARDVIQVMGSGIPKSIVAAIIVIAVSVAVIAFIYTSRSIPSTSDVTQNLNLLEPSSSRQTNNRTLVLVADFDGPDKEKYRVTELLLTKLRGALAPYADVEAKSLGRSIMESEGSNIAQMEGKRLGGDIVIWGWYGVTSEVVTVGIHFELLGELGAQYPVFQTCAASNNQIRTASPKDISNISLQTNLSDELAYMTIFSVGLARFASGKWEEATSRFSEALERLPEDIVLSAQTTQQGLLLDKNLVYFLRGIAYEFQGKSDLAIADYSRVMESSPSDYSLVFLRGEANYKRGNFSAAIEDFTQAINLTQPGSNAIAYYKRGQVYQANGEIENAIADYNEALQRGNEDIVVYSIYDIVLTKYEGSASIDELIAHFAKEIETTPKNALAYYERGVVYEVLKQPEEALADYKRVRELNPNIAYVYSHLAWDYRSRKDWNAALAAYSKAIELNSADYPCFFVGRAYVYKALGNQEAARVDLESAITLYNKIIEESPEARQYLARARAYGQLGRWLNSIADLIKSIQLDPRQLYEDQPDWWKILFWLAVLSPMVLVAFDKLRPLLFGRKAKTMR